MWINLLRTFFYLCVDFIFLIRLILRALAAGGDKEACITARVYPNLAID